MRLFLLLLILTPKLLYAWVSVGFSPGFGECDYGFIQDALDANETELRVVAQEFTENLVIDSSIDINGGYASCLATALGDVGLTSTNTVIKGDGILGAPAIKVDSSIQSNYTINLNNLTVRDAVDTSLVDGGHGIEIGDTSVLLSIENSLIINNTAENGGGIYIGNPVDTDVFIKDSSIFGNMASNRGGGIFCGNANTVVRIIDESLIGENTALDGGGIFAINGCKVIIDSGIDVNTSSDLRGVMGNFATNNGGGIYADLAAEIFLYGNTYISFLFISGNSTQPVTLAGNEASNNGGGIYADRNSTVQIIDGLLTNNTSSSLGGGFYINDNSELTIKQSSNSSCWNTDKKCSILSNNKSTTNGGGIYIRNESQVTVENSYIFGNRSGRGTVVYARDDLTSLTLLNDVIYENGDNGLNGYSDNHVIRGFNGPDITIHHSTIADNDANDANAILGMTGTGTLFSIYNSIVNNGSELVLDNVSGAFYLTSCVLVNETSTLMGAGVANLNLSFVDPLNDDYHLANDSDAIDYCLPNDSIVTLEEDIDKQFRSIDYPNIPNAFGLADAGADEFHNFNLPDAMFANGFE